MSDKPPAFDCDDPSTWQHKDEKIDLPRLLQLIEENGGPVGLDLHGCDMSGIDARPQALSRYAEAYADKHDAVATPPWLGRDAWNVFSINLLGAHLESANLSFAWLENADVRGAHLEKAYLGGAHLQNAHLSGAHLEDALLWGTHLENAYLPFAGLKNTSLRGANLTNAHIEFSLLQNADLSDALLENADLSGADLCGALWYGAHLDRARLSRQQLGRAVGDELAAKGRRPAFGTFRRAREAYLELKTNFDSIGRYDDASWAYVKEQQMEKAMYFPTTRGHRWIRDQLRSGARRWRKKNPGRLRRFVRASILGRVRWAWFHLRLFVGLRPPDIKRYTEEIVELVLPDIKRQIGKEEEEHLDRPRWLRNWGYELLTGYGERAFRPVIWAFVVVLLFALIYTAAGNIASGDVGALEGQPTHSPITALVHSISAFATIGFNTLEPQGWGARLLTALEAMFGIGLFALFVFTLGNRMRRS